jgi:peroxiredoxin
MPRRPGQAWIAAGIAAAALAAFFAGPEAPQRIGRGSPAPPFRLERLGGGAPVDLDALRGRVVLINFWATWCKPCEDEMPAMERLYRQLAGQGLELLAVSVDDEPEVVQAFASRLQLTFPILMDPDERVARSYQTFRYPETLLVDREGVVVERFVGPKDWDAPAYVAHVQRLLDDAGG